VTANAVVLIREEHKAGRGISTRTSDQVRKVKGVVDAFPVTGRADIVAFLEAASFEQVRAAALKIQSVPGIRTTETLLTVA
jgi:DNA-binding Lrp family transcriptional regulator